MGAAITVKNTSIQGVNMPKKSRSEWHTYSFKCREGEHDDLIAILDGTDARSEWIRNSLRKGNGLPSPSAMEGLTVDELRAELGRLQSNLVGYLKNLQPVMISSETSKRRDVNDNAKNIPDF